MYGIGKGCFVSNASQNRGVVDQVVDRHAYVYWFMSYDSQTGKVQSFLEYVSLEQVTLLDDHKEIHNGLHALRAKVIR